MLKLEDNKGRKDDPFILRKQPSILVALVSKDKVFSKRLCRVTEAELEDTDVKSFCSLSGLLETFPDWEGLLRLVVLDEMSATDLDLDQAGHIRDLSGAHFVSAYNNSDTVSTLFSKGIYPRVLSSMFPFDLNFDSWISMLKLCLAGHDYVTPALFRSPAPGVSESLDPRPKEMTPDGGMVTEMRRCPLGSLTEREGQVLRLVAQGLQNKTIAMRLNLSENTVKLHVHRVISKLGVHNRTQATMVYANARV